MATIDCPPASDFVAFGDQASWLKELPKILALPGGHLMVNYLLFQAVRILRAAATQAETILDAPWYSSLSMQERAASAEMAQQHTETIRADIAQLRSIARPGIFMRLLLNQCEASLIRFSDLAETLAISADPEMTTLGKELNNVL